MSSKQFSHSPEYNTLPSLRISVIEGMYCSIMVGLGEAYLGQFCIALGGTPFQLGLISTLPPLIGAISMLLGVWSLDRFTSRRKLIVPAALFQALTWLVILTLPFSPLSGNERVFCLIALSCLYFASGNLGAPAWSSLIGDLVPANVRGRYFGYRNQQCGWATFLAMIAGGLALELATRLHHEAIGYVVLFIISFLARARSSYFLSTYDDPVYSPKKEDYFSFWDFLRRSPRSNFARFVYFIALMSFAVNISGPFVLYYLRHDLQTPYLPLSALTGVVLVTQFLTMQNWGRLVDEFGSRRILGFCGFGLAIIPGLWVVSSQFWWIFCVQAYSGVCWAGFNLSTSNFMFDAVTPPKRARCAAFQTFINTIFVFSGALTGGYLAEHLPHDLPLSHGIWTIESNYFRLFLLSCFLRFGVLALFYPLFREVRDVSSIGHRDLFFRVASLRPVSGLTFWILPGRNGNGGSK